MRMLTISTITRQDVARALRLLRKARRLTQAEVSQRAEAFHHLEFGFGRLLESQVSDFERGKALPSLGSFLALLAACSEDAESISLSDFDIMLALVTGQPDTPSPERPEAALPESPGGDSGLVHLAARQLERRSLQGEISELRRRLEFTHSRVELLALEVEKR